MGVQLQQDAWNKWPCRQQNLATDKRSRDLILMTDGSKLQEMKEKLLYFDLFNSLNDKAHRNQWSAAEFVSGSSLLVVLFQFY